MFSLRRQCVVNEIGDLKSDPDLSLTFGHKRGVKANSKTKGRLRGPKFTAQESLVTV